MRYIFKFIIILTLYFTFLVGDGRLGLEKYAPYNAIHVGAAAEKIPKPVIL